MTDRIPREEAIVRRRREIGQWVAHVWTQGGSCVSGIVDPWMDGRLAALGRYVTFHDDSDDSLFCASGSGGDAEAGSGQRECHGRGRTIDRIHCNDLTYEDFVSRYLRPNRPVIIRGLAEDWRATWEWTSITLGVAGDEKRLVPNVEHLAARFGRDQVKVMEQAGPGFGPTRPIAREMSLSQYADYWQEYHCETSTNEKNDDDSSGMQSLPILYLKDYKFVVAHPSDRAYEWPSFFRDDWLNSAMGNAYKFVYLGPRGSSTVLHADVVRSHSWSTNVCGRKRWHLIPPEHAHLLCSCIGGGVATHLDADAGEMAQLYPGLALARESAIEVEQEAGETIFVPSDWFHSVENLDPTLSINHNWLNGYNLQRCWNHLRSELSSSLQSSSRSTTLSASSSSSSYSQDNSQVMDDVVLLWHVISHRARQLLSECDSGEENREQLVCDGRSILRVLKDFQDVVDEGAIDKAVFGDPSHISELSASLERIVR